MICLLAIGLSFQSKSQKKPLTHEVYDDWKSIQHVTISHDGVWLAYRIVPQVGDAVLKIRNLNTAEEMTIDRVNTYSFAANSRFLAAQIKPEYALERALKLKKTVAAKMPKDSLCLLNLNSGEQVKVARVKSFQLPEENSPWMAYILEKPLKEKEKETKEEIEEKTEKAVPGAEKLKGKGEKKPDSEPEGTELVLHHLETAERKSFARVTDYLLTKQGNYLYFEQEEADTAGIYAYATALGTLTALNEGMTDYQKMSADDSGEQLAFLATASDKKDKEKYWSLMYRSGTDKAQILVDTTTKGMPQDWMLSEQATIRFSESGKRLYLGTAPEPVKYAYEQDTTLLKDDKPDVDVWAYNDPYIQPMQKLRAKHEKNRAYTAMLNLDDGNFVQLGSSELEQINVDYRNDHDFFISVTDKPYRTQYTWDVQLPRDVYKIDAATGASELLIKGTKGVPSLSPAGKYLVIFNPEDGHWYAMDIATKTLKNLTEGLKVSFANELHDSPSLAGAYGRAGWSKGDEAIYLYDRYDIWKFDPVGNQKPVLVTKGEGRRQKIIYRYTRLDPEAQFIDTGSPVILSLFNEWTKASGYAKADFKNGSVPKTIVAEDMRIYDLQKAKEADRVLLRKSTYRDFPEVYAANDLNMTNIKKLSNAGAQLAPYNRGTAELIAFESGYDGETMQAILYKPENFDPNKKYPMIVYFYERRSQSLHSHASPAPSASTINIPYYVSNDYLVLVPDIKYEIGHPGRSAMNHVVPATRAVMKMGFVDDDKMAIQGQSWGGYQVAHIVTRTNLYAAAGAGAPVSNMTSAYGGVRWGSGMSRMFQYEKTQSRIGATLWEKPELYIENSPLFHVPDIETPLFIMHNDADGAVPWYQGIEFYMSLRRLQKPTWMVVYNDEDHNLRKRKNKKDLSIRMGQFFDHYLKGTPMPVWMDKGLPATLKNRTLRYEKTVDGR